MLTMLHASVGPCRVFALGGIPEFVWDQILAIFLMHQRLNCLIVKSQHLNKARALFHGTGVVITDAGKHHLVRPWVPITS